MRPIDLQKEHLTEKEKRSINILEILRRRGPVSRPEISKETGINVVTISNYIDDLIKNRLVYEKELDVSEGGRRPVLLDLNPKGAYVIGVGLNLMNMVGVLTDFKGNIILKTQVDRPGVSVKEVVGALLDIIREIVRRSKDYTKDIKGVGVGIAGIIDKKGESIRWPEKANGINTNYTSVNVHLGELIEREFGLPVIIENDATAACFGEHWLRLDPSIKNIIFMFSGVGCGIMINEQIYTGSRGCAGEPSIFSYKDDPIFNCCTGNPCFLKRWEVDLEIVDSVKKELIKDKQAAEKFFELTSVSPDKIDLKTVFAAAKAKEPTAALALDLAAKRLGIKIAYLVDVLNPQIVIIGGGLEDAGEEFLNKVNSVVRDWAFREVTEDLKIVYSQLRGNAVALGAASLVMQKLFAQLC